MKITHIEPIVVEVTERGDWVFVLVHTDAGITGLGEASHSLNDALLVATLEVFADQLVGQDPLAIRKIGSMLSGVLGGRITHTAVSAIDQALWDILGQHLGVPIHALFGGAVRRKLRLYANINRHVRDRSPEGFAAAARQAVDEGFAAVKLAPFDELRGPDHVRTGPRASWRPGVDRVRAVRVAIGDEIDLAIDCHGRMEASEAIVVGRELEDCNLMWYEEPVKHTFPDQLALISRSVPMPTASAESVFAVEGFRSFLLERVVDVLMPDVKHCGGLSEMQSIADAARLKQLLIAPHNPSGPVATVSTAHSACTISNFLVLEYAWGEVDWRADLITPREPVQDGYLIVSDTPGLGYKLNMDVVTAHRREVPGTADSTKVRV
ncbi:MAG: mandelate racemase/muconate lactonizing enzyme family protein [Anaerolineae bacterium]|nr:mandelate racemase/muconate lactonizing enzyme family protein [Anaerolineae bacterium]